MKYVGYDWLKNIVDNAPYIELEKEYFEKKGNWTEDKDGYICSNCWYVMGEGCNFKYCPNCGSRNEIVEARDLT